MFYKPAKIFSLGCHIFQYGNKLIRFMIFCRPVLNSSSLSAKRHYCICLPSMSCIGSFDMEQSIETCKLHVKTVARKSSFHLLHNKTKSPLEYIESDNKHFFECMWCPKCVKVLTILSLSYKLSLPSQLTCAYLKNRHKHKWSTQPNITVQIRSHIVFYILLLSA